MKLYGETAFENLKTTTHFNILNTVSSFKIQNAITTLNTYGQKQQLTKTLNLAANIKIG